MNAIVHGKGGAGGWHDLAGALTLAIVALLFVLLPAVAILASTFLLKLRT